MKLFVFVALMGYASAARLSNSYIPPPNSAGSAGGAGFLQTPNNPYGGGSPFGGQGNQKYGSGQHIPILRYENVNNGDGSYHFDYATGNGIMQHEQGHLNNPGSENPEQVVQGQYSYTGDDGKEYKVTYKADANGFQAVGDHLPTSPPIPEAIQKSLALNAAAGGGYNQGAYVAPSVAAGFGGRPQQAYLPPGRQSFNPNSGYQY